MLENVALRKRYKPHREIIKKIEIRKTVEVLPGLSNWSLDPKHTRGCYGKAIQYRLLKIRPKACTTSAYTGGRGGKSANVILGTNMESGMRKGGKI
jgi:hypothetical protein